MASIHLDVRSIIVKIRLHLLLSCNDPTKSMLMWEKRRWEKGMWRGLCPGVALDLALLAVQAGLGPGFHVLSKAAPDIPR
jgi:hypothetical protein